MAQILDDVKLDFQDVLILPKRSTLDSRSKVVLERTYTFKNSGAYYTGIPILAANMDSVGTMSMAKAFQNYQLGIALHKFYSKEQLIEFLSKKINIQHTFYSLGITDEDYVKFQEVMAALPQRCPFICIDVANGYSRKFVDRVSYIREQYPTTTIMAGNVVTGDMVYDLLERGADIVKVGIGSGSVCTTRKITGVGYPQLSAILECADAAHGAGGHICSDGGITCPGDLSKAFAAGADFVMCGGVFAGHTECEGEFLNGDYIPGVLERLAEIRNQAFQMKETRYGEVKVSTETWIAEFNSQGTFVNAKGVPLSFYKTDGKPKMRFYGMSSQDAMDKHYGGKAEYRAAEGKAVEIPYKGDVSKTIEEYLGGLRSTCTYVGARRLKDLSKCTTFVRVNRILNQSLSMYDV